MKSNTSLTPSAIRLFCTAVLAAAVLVSLPGCLAVAAGAGAGVVAYVRGDLETSVTTEYAQVVDATRAAIKNLEFAQVSENKDALKAVFVARTALDKKVEINLSNSGKKLTSIKIRVGVFGDEQLSLAVLDKIKAGL